MLILRESCDLGIKVSFIRSCLSRLGFGPKPKGFEDSQWCDRIRGSHVSKTIERGVRKTFEI
jgi:hypothetical protein